MKIVRYFRDIKDMPKNLKNKSIGLLKMVNDYWDIDYILNMKDFYILYDNKKVYCIINHFGKLTNEDYFFFNDNKDINTFNVSFYNDYEDCRELLEHLNKKYNNILIWKTNNIYSSCFPSNFKYQVQYKENISILSEDYKCFSSSYISNLEEDYLLNLYLKYQYYNKVDINEIEYTVVDNLCELLYDANSGDMKLPIYFDSTSALKLCEPYDEEGTHIVGLYNGRLVFDLCLQKFDDKIYLYYICTRKDLYNKGIATKGIEFLSKLNFDKIYGTDLTIEGQKTHINDIMNRYLQDKFIPSKKELF